MKRRQRNRARRETGYTLHVERLATLYVRAPFSPVAPRRRGTPRTGLLTDEQITDALRRGRAERLAVERVLRGAPC